MVDVNTVVGFLVTWAIRESQPEFKSQHRSDDVDQALEDLARLAMTKLAASVVYRMRREVLLTTKLRRRTKEQLVSVLATAVQNDPDFARALDAAVTALRSIVGETAESAEPGPADHVVNVVNVFNGTVGGTNIQIGRVHGDVTLGPLNRDE